MYQKTSKAGKGTVLVGMTGRMDSTIAAYLLKKQGYNCIGVSLVFYDKTVMEPDFTDLYSGVHIDDIANVKRICDALEMPFYGVNAQDIFKAEILDRAVAGRILGRFFNTDVYSNVLKLKLLIEKADLLGAEYVATGHYAKINFNQSTQDYSLVVANDAENDQSYGLSQLEQKHLSRLLLPLADMRLVEVEKIAASLGFPVDDSLRGESPNNAYFFHPNFVKFVERFSAPSLRKSGTIICIDDDVFCADHSGIYKFYVGQENVEGESGAIDSKLKVVSFKNSKRIVYVGDPENHVGNQCYLTGFKTELKSDVSKPSKAFVQFKNYDQKYKCLLMFKNNNSVYLEIEDIDNAIVAAGQYAVIYNRQGPGAKVIGGGTVLKCGQIDPVDRVKSLVKEEDEVGDEFMEKKKKKLPAFTF